MDKLRAVLGGRDGNNDNRNVLQAANEASTLGWGTRLKGFLVFVVIGVVCTILRFDDFTVKFEPTPSTMFLMGPLKQLKRMCDKTRAFATIVMITCLVLTLCAAFWWKIFALTLLFVILQVLAFAWYSLSYIPFARDAVLKFFSMMCNMCVK
uniref:Vesicle transport protein n=1 Tax=Cyprinus carpio carpio TaxID=630221 RepID=A0A9J7YAS0_CYPCA